MLHHLLHVHNISRATLLHPLLPLPQSIMLVPTAQAHRSTETMQEFTNYHFDVKPNALYGALDRFAQFFIDPLCKADALEREVMAVDNEFSGKAPSANSQLQQQSHLMCTAHQVWKHLFIMPGLKCVHQFVSVLRHSELCYVLQESYRVMAAVCHSCGATQPSLDTSTTSSAGATGRACLMSPKPEVLL